MSAAMSLCCVGVFVWVYDVLLTHCYDDMTCVLRVCIDDMFTLCQIDMATSQMNTGTTGLGNTMSVPHPNNNVPPESCYHLGCLLMHTQYLTD